MMHLLFSKVTGKIEGVAHQYDPAVPSIEISDEMGLILGQDPRLALQYLVIFDASIRQYVLREKQDVTNMTAVRSWRMFQPYDIPAKKKYAGVLLFPDHVEMASNIADYEVRPLMFAACRNCDPFNVVSQFMLKTGQSAMFNAEDFGRADSIFGPIEFEGAEYYYKRV